ESVINSSSAGISSSLARRTLRSVFTRSPSCSGGRAARKHSENSSLVADQPPATVRFCDLTHPFIFVDREFGGRESTSSGFAQSIEVPVLLPEEKLEIGLEMQYRSGSETIGHEGITKGSAIGPTIPVAASPKGMRSSIPFPRWRGERRISPRRAWPRCRATAPETKESRSE